MADDNNQKRETWKIPIGAIIDRKTGDMKLLFRDGTRKEFIAVMRPIMEAAKVLSKPAKEFGIKQEQNDCPLNDAGDAKPTDVNS